MIKTMLTAFFIVMNLSAADTISSIKLNIAVSTLEGRGLAEGESSTLTDALSNYLANTTRFRVMERGRMDVILKEQGFQQSGACNDAACIVEMGQLLGVDHMVTGSIGKVGQTFSMNLRVINVATGEIVRSLNRYYKGEIDGILTEILPNVAEELALDKVEEKTPVPEQKTESKPLPVAKEDKVKKRVFGKRFGLGASFNNTLGQSVELGSEKYIVNDNYKVPSMTLFLRLFKKLEINFGLTKFDPSYQLIGVSGDVEFRESKDSSIYLKTGKIDVTMESERPGIMFGLGYLFNPSSRLALSINSSITNYSMNVKGKLILPNITVPVPLNIFGHEDETSSDNPSTITLFNTSVYAEWSFMQRLSLSLGLGLTLCDESWDYSEGYRRWIEMGWIKNQPKEDYYFTIKGMSITTMLKWYWF